MQARHNRSSKPKKRTIVSLLLISLALFVVFNASLILANDFDVNPDVFPYNDTEGEGSGVYELEEKVITSFVFIFNTTTTNHSDCRYHLLNLSTPLNSYNYTNATLGNCDLGPGPQVEYGLCGDMDTIDSEMLIHKKILNYTKRGDMEKIRYGFYCASETLSIYAQNDLIFTIDTTPPDVLTDDGTHDGKPLVSFKDSSFNVSNISTLGSDPVIHSSSWYLTMQFDINELGQCRYAISDSAVNQLAYTSMTADLYPFDHAIGKYGNISLPIGLRRYIHIACMDRFENKDNSTEAQTAYHDTPGVLLLLVDPQCSNLSINASDVPNDDGGSINLTWNRCSEDGLNNDYITRYAIYRSGNRTKAGNSSLSKADIYSGAYTDLTNIANITATDAVKYNYVDSTTDDNVNYYYYVLAMYHNDTIPEIMQNVKRNMSCYRVSSMTNSTDEGYPAPIGNLTAMLAMDAVLGNKLKLNWTLSPDDGSGSNDVVNYTVFRQVFGTASETLGYYDNLTMLSAGSTQYQDSNLSPFIKYCYIVMTTDDYNLSSNSTKLCVTPNSRAQYANISVTPLIAKTMDNLTCTAFIHDYDGDDLRDGVNFTWTIYHISTYETTNITVDGSCTLPVNGSFQIYNFTNYTTECIANLSYIHFNKGDKVWCSVKAWDGDEFGKDPATNRTYLISDYHPINNSAPYASNVFIWPGTPNGSSNLECNYTFNDVDNDQENLSLAQFKWFINNDGLNSFTEVLGQAGKTLSSSFIDQNDLVMCSVKPHDVDNTWIDNPLSATSFVNSSHVTVIDNSVPQVIDFSAVPFNSDENVTIIGNLTEFKATWFDVDQGEMVKMHVCDAFSESETQAADTLYHDKYVHFGDNSTNNVIRTILYANETGRYVSRVSIKPFAFERNGYFVFAAGSIVHSADYDNGGSLSYFPGNITYYDSDVSGQYSPGEPIVNDTNQNYIYEPAIDKMIRGKKPPYLATLINISKYNQRFSDLDGDGYNASVDYIYYDKDGNSAISENDTRLEFVAQDNNSEVHYTAPIYDMYVYEVDYPNESVAGKTLIAQDNNNWFVLGTYNHFNPQYNAQPLPDKYLAFVLCIDIDDDTVCDSNLNYKDDFVYVRALEDQPTGDFYVVNDTSTADLDYNPEIRINYEASVGGSCLRKSFCSTDQYSSESNLSCYYQVRETDNQTTSYSVRVCDDENACSVARSGTFVINHIPTMRGVYIGSNSNTTAIGTNNNLMCMHTGANDEVIQRGDFILDADGNLTIFGDVRNNRDNGLTHGITIIPFNSTNRGSLTWDSTYYQDGVNFNRDYYIPNNDALVADMDGNNVYNAAIDVIIYNPFNSLREGDRLLNVNFSSTNLSYYDTNSDSNYSWSATYPEDIVYNAFAYDNDTFNEHINFSFLWYVKPLSEPAFKPATDFSWYDNDYNDILTHGNTMPGDQWVCQVTPTDEYGYGMPLNATTVTIGSGGVNPTLAPTIINIVDDSNSTRPTAISKTLNININYTDPDSTMVKAYVCNSSQIIRNSGCWEKEFNRTIESGEAGILQSIQVIYVMEDDYNMTPTNYTVMLCDPEYHCSDVWNNQTFYATWAPEHTSSSPTIVPYPPGTLVYPRNYSTLKNLLCNISFIDRDREGWETNISYNTSNATYSWYLNRTGLYQMEFSGLRTPELSYAATQTSDRWICEATIIDEVYASASSFPKNSSEVIIGTYVTETESFPTIDLVLTDSNYTNPKNYNDSVTFNVSWHHFESPTITAFICNSSNAVPSGCLDIELVRNTSVISPILLSYKINESDLKYMKNNTLYTENYTLFVADMFGNIVNYSDSSSIATDDLAANYLPFVISVNVTNVTGTQPLSCRYTFIDYDGDSTSRNSSSMYYNDSSVIKWFNNTGSTWLEYSFKYWNDQVPAFMTHEGDEWLCEVTPYDGYAYGTPVNATSITVGDTSPQINNYQLLYQEGLTAVAVTASSPITLDEMLIVSVNWTDPDNTKTRLFVFNNASMQTGRLLYQSPDFSTENPITATFNTSLLSNSTNNINQFNITNNFSFILFDETSNNSNWSTDLYNISVYVNRKPYINGSVTVNRTIYADGGGYFECMAVVNDTDIIADYNTTNISYQWYMSVGTTSEYSLMPGYTYRQLPFGVISPGQKWLCQVKPCDYYICGTSRNSTNYVTIANETPEILSVGVYNINVLPDASVSYVENTNITPAKYGDEILFNITWDDSDIYGAGENANIYICEKNSTNELGCLNATQYCSNISTNGYSFCTLDTDFVNITVYDSNAVNYSIVIYDSLGRQSEYYNSNFTIDQAPYIRSVNITPSNPSNNTIIFCNYSYNDNDTNTVYNGSANNVVPHFVWYLNRSGVVTEQSFNTHNVTPDLTRTLDRWLCQVTPTDSYVNGTPVNTSWTTIGSNVSYNNSPSILGVTIDSNLTHPTLVGDNITFSIEWGDAQQPDEIIRVMICNSSNYVNSTGCVDRGFVNVWGETSNPVVVSYKIQETDFNIIDSTVLNGTMPYYVVICDDSDLCSNAYNSSEYNNSFSLVRKPEAINATISGPDTLDCNFTLWLDSNASLSYTELSNRSRSIVVWYNKTKYSGFKKYTGPLFDNKVPAYITQNESTWICQVTPYDGFYYYGEAVNSTPYVVYSNDTPIIAKYDLLHDDALETLVTASAPINYLGRIKVRVHWYDADNASTKLYILNQSDVSTASVYYVSDGFTYANPVVGYLNSTNITNLSSYVGNSNITGNFTMRIFDGENFSAVPTLSTTVFVNRLPQINGTVNLTKKNVTGTGGYYECLASVLDNDTFANYNTTNKTYRWFNNSGLGYELASSLNNKSKLLLSTMHAGEKWICEVAPCDNYGCGTPVNSSHKVLINETPQISAVQVWNYYETSTSTVIYRRNTNTTPAKFGDNISFNITWDDSDLYSLGETASIFVCEENNTISQGCINTTEYCRATSTNGIASCVYDTSNVNISKYSNATVNFSIIVYDSTGKYSDYHTSNFSIDQAPVVDWVNISPDYPFNTSTLGCSYLINDNDTNSAYNSSSDTPKFTWYLNRSSTITKEPFTGQNITPDLTQPLDWWRCEITPVGYVNGTVVNSSWVIVGTNITYSDVPNITRVLDDSNITHPTTVGEYVSFSIDWTDAQQPYEPIRVLICNSTNIVNNTGCVDTGFVNVNGITVNPAVVRYRIKISDKNLGDNSANNRTIPYHVVICDDSLLCSDIYNGTNNYNLSFSVNHRPNASNVRIIPQSSGNLLCNYTFDDDSTDYYNTDNSVIKWYRSNGSVSYCGDGYIDQTVGEQCEGDDMGFSNPEIQPENYCSFFGYQPGDGTLRCYQHNCSYDTRLCVPTAGGYCGDGVAVGWEQCDGDDFQTYQSCADIGSFTGGVLACNDDCTLNASGCTGGWTNFCGNGVLEFGEECETVGGSILGNYDQCSDFPYFLGGTLSCNSSCQYNYSDCVTSPDLYVDLGVYGPTLPKYAFQNSDKLICEIKPYDGYSYGNYELSQMYTAVNETPQIISINEIDYYSYASPTINTISAPMLYGYNITVNLTWDDFNSYTPLGEQVKIFICNDTNATYQGCLANQLCSVPFTSNKNVQCTFNSSNLSINNTGDGNNLTYSAFIYDDSKNSSYVNDSIYVNRVPVLLSYNITTTSGDIIPEDSDNLNCTYVMYDPDNMTNTTPEMNMELAYFKWFLFRNNTWHEFDNGGNQVIGNYFTEPSDTWVCQLTYGDGIFNATPVNTSSVSVRDNDYELTVPNITSVMIVSANTYHGPFTSYQDASGTVVYHYDNTTNVGDDIRFTIYWYDADQLGNNSELVQMYLCNSTDFLVGAGCLNRTLLFINYTNTNPIEFNHTALAIDASIQNFSITLCDDTWQCSNMFVNNFSVNHRPGGYAPDIMYYTNLSGDTIIECDYETDYYYGNGSGDNNASGDRLLEDDISKAHLIWYKDEGLGYQALSLDNETKISIPLNSTDKVLCSVNITDVFDLSSGFLNSSELDLSKIPVLWPLTSLYHNGFYVKRNDNPTQNGSVNLIGYLPKDQNANVSAIAYYDFHQPIVNLTSNLMRSSTLQGSTAVAISTENGTSYILVDRITGITSKFAQGNYLGMESHNLSYFWRYNITTTPYEVQQQIYKIEISPALNTTTTVGETVTAYSGSTAKYPYGWFNLSLEIYNGSNKIKIMSNNSGTLGAAKFVNLFYESATPTISLAMNNPTLSLYPTIEFNLSDDYFVNLSTLFLNISNGTQHTYHFSSTNRLNISEFIIGSSTVRGSDVICTEVNSSFHECSLTLNLSKVYSSTDTYFLAINVTDIFDRIGNISTSFVTKASTIGAPVSFAQPVQNDTNLTFGLLLNTSNITMIEYAVGTAPYPDDGWNSVRNATNLTSMGSFNLSDLIKFVDFNYNIYLDSTEAQVNSTDLNLSSDDTINISGLGLRNFSRNKERYNCSGNAFDRNCFIIYDNNNNRLYDNDSDLMLYNTSKLSNGSVLANLTTLSLQSFIKYFDVNNDSAYTFGEPVFNSTDQNIDNNSEIIINSSRTSLTLYINTTDLNLSPDHSYRIAVRYYINNTGTYVPSAWTYTNPIVYKPRFNGTYYSGPSAVEVYDKNSTHSEPHTIVDVAYDNTLQFNWTESVPANEDQGETILFYEYALGNEPYPYDSWKSVHGWTRVSSDVRSITVNESIRRQLITGQMYYITVRPLSSFGLYGPNASSNGIVYNDLTAPNLSVIDVGGDNTAPYLITERKNPFVVTLRADENLSECGYSIYFTPFDRYYVITKRCNDISPTNQTYVTCNLTNMDMTSLEEGDYTFYISCLDVNQNANQVIGTNPTKSVGFTYNYPEFPNVTNAAVWGMFNTTFKKYAYKDTFLYCNYSWTDGDGGSITEEWFRWYKNGQQLPPYFSADTLNITQTQAVRGDNYSCAVKIKDSTGRWSNVTRSLNLSINNTAPTPPTLLSPINNSFVTDNVSFSWDYSSDVDGDNLSYFIVLMNRTEYDTGYTIVNNSVRTGNENNTFAFNLSTYADGVYYWVITTCDNSSSTGINYTNNCTNSTDMHMFTKDSTGPLVHILVPDNNTRIGFEFSIIADVYDTNYPNVGVSVVWYEIYNNSGRVLSANMTHSSGNLYEGYINNNLTAGDYTLYVNATDTLGNNGSSVINIVIDNIEPVLQIDWPPWVFREQYLNHNFNLNLTAYNATIINYTIKNSSGSLIQSNHKQFIEDQTMYRFTDTVYVDTLPDGRYDINFSAVDKLDNPASKTSWFAVDRTPPEPGTATYDSVVYSGATAPVSIKWFNNSLVPDDNLYGVKYVKFFFNASNVSQDSMTQAIQYVSATSTVVIGSTHYYNISSSYVTKDQPYIQWHSYACDYAGNCKYSPNYSITVGNHVPYLNSTIQDIVLYEDVGNDTINLSAHLFDTEREVLSFSTVLLPEGVLLYDPLDSEERSEALGATAEGLNTLFTGIVYNNATLIERAHNNLLLNPGFEESYVFTDENGTYRTDAPTEWVLKNNASYDNSTGAYNYSLYLGDKAGVRVSAKNYFYQEVDVQASTYYSLSQYMKADSTRILGRLHINWYDSAGSFINTTLNMTNNVVRPNLTTSWRRYNLTVVSPSNASKARIYIDTDDNNTYAHVDNVVFEDTALMTNYNREDHAAGYIRYPVSRSNSNRPYINATIGTLEITMKPTWNGNTTDENYLFDASGSSATDYFYVRTDGNGNISFKFGNLSITKSIENWTNESVWRLAFTWNATNVSSNNSIMNMYINGTLNASKNISVKPTIGNYLYLGSKNTATRQIDAILDELVVFDHVRNSTQIVTDYNTKPVNNTANTDKSTYTIVYLNSTINNTPTSPVYSIPHLNVSPLNDHQQPNLTYHQRTQFFGSDGRGLVSSNVIDITVITNDNIFVNVTLYNASGQFNYTNNITDQEANSITHSQIYNSVLHNKTAPLFSITFSTLNFTNINDSKIIHSKVNFSQINLSNISTDARINGSKINASSITNSKVWNSTVQKVGTLSCPAWLQINRTNISTSNITNSLIQNSILVNSSVINNTVPGLRCVKIINSPDTVIDSEIFGSIVSDDSTVQNSTINGSIINRSIINFSTIIDSRINYSIITNASINNSNITNCTINTVTHDNQTSDIGVLDAVLLGDTSRLNCRLMNGSVTVNQSNHRFVYSVASYTAQPLVNEIWNITPNVTPIGLSNYSNISRINLTLQVSIVDEGLGNTIMDYVDVGWIVAFNSTNTTTYTALDLNYSNLSLANQSIPTQANDSAMNITLMVNDSFGNNYLETFYYVNYTYSLCGNSHIDSGETCDSNTSVSCTASGGYPGTYDCNSLCTGWTSCVSTGTQYCGDGEVNGNEECDGGNNVSGDGCSATCQIESGGGSPGGGGGGGSGSRWYCYNGVKDENKGETGIDCGGRCMACEDLCDDGKWNGLEEKRDCGGVCDPCEDDITGLITGNTCLNGRKDYNEEGIDCGGVCTKSCSERTPDVVVETPAPTCFDGTKNGNEEGIDCGGSCEPCAQQSVIDEDTKNWLYWYIIIFVILAALLLIGIIVLVNRRRYSKIEKEEAKLKSKLTEEETMLASMNSMKGKAGLPHSHGPGTLALAPVSTGQSLAGASDKALYAKQDALTKGPISDSVIELEKYIVESLDNGLKPSRIKELVIESGWSPAVSEVVLHKIMLSGDKLEEVERYISGKIRQGLSDNEIAVKLIGANWSKEIVDLIISDVHKISENADRIHVYINKKLDEGKTLHDIHQMLVSIGWNERYIERILQKY